jgi:tRNA pseudouridine55 synthase
MEADGVLLIDKPSGCTSHDVVDYVRNRFHFKKVGHCGTLDPLATGLLMLVIGKATKIQDLLMAEDKEYAATMKLGAVTDSQDADGKTLEEKPVPELTREQLEVAFKKYTGDFYQIPPMVSALKQGGVPLYKLARAGKTVEREPRLVHITSYIIDDVALPLIKFRQDLGCGAHLVQLSRLKSGNFSLERALSWDTLQKTTDAQALLPSLLTLPEVSRLRRR